MGLSDEQIDALDRMLRPIIEAERAQAQRELIERMIADTEASNVTQVIGEFALVHGEQTCINQRSLSDYLRAYLPTEGADDDDPS